MDSLQTRARMMRACVAAVGLAVFARGVLAGELDDLFGSGDPAPSSSATEKKTEAPTPVTSAPPPQAPSAVTQAESRPRKSLVRSFNLPVLSVRQKFSGKVQGRCSFLPLSVSVTDSQAPLRISFSDDTPDGSGETIRNSLWTAALIAGLQKESALQGVRIALDFKGGMDGPSAGAIMCLGIMTALDGREFPDDFAMTGAILPDGTVGLVGSVAVKIRAAASSGKIKRVAIPAFQRFEYDADEEKWVDLLGLGKSLGLELRLVESIGDAYRFLHGDKALLEQPISVLDVCRESSAFETKASEIFEVRDKALRDRLNGLSSNELATVTHGWEWKDVINPRISERRFAEGAIFDALSLISHSDAYIPAILESWKFYNEYYDEFANAVDANEGNPFSSSLADKPIREWPLEQQLAFVDGFRERIQNLCERVLGWRTDEEKSEEDEDKDDEPWHGFIPDVGSSDLAAQLLSVVEFARAEGLYRFMDLQTYDREKLEDALKSGERTIINEIDYDRKKLFFLMAQRFRKPSFSDVPLPILNCGPASDSALELFRNAWKVTDKMIETDVVDSMAANASAHKDTVRNYLVGQSSEYAVYDAAKSWGNLFLGLFDEARADGVNFHYHGWTVSTFLFNMAELFAEASAQLLQLNHETDNASFMAFVTDRARTTALHSMDACRKADIPCFSAVLSFQKAERDRASDGEDAISILTEYWKATMFAKALVMAFKDGKGPAQGFSGYPEPPEVAEAKVAMSVMLDALLNAETKPFLKALPQSWITAVSDAASVIAQKSDDATWNALRRLIGQAGLVLTQRGDFLAEFVAEGEDASDGSDSPIDWRAAFDNWGGRLLGLCLAGTRESIAGGGLAKALQAPKRRWKESDGNWRLLPLPQVKAHMNADGTVSVSIPEWEDMTSLAGLFDSGSDLFKKAEGKMVLVDLAKAFKNSPSFRATVESALSELDPDGIQSLRPAIESLAASLQKAALCTDKDSFKEVFESIDWDALFPDQGHQASE